MTELQKPLQHSYSSGLYSNNAFNSDEYVVRSPFPEITIPKKTFPQLIWERHENWKNRKAVECGITGIKYTYGELLERSGKIGRGLLSIGLRPEDVLAILLPNMPDYIATILGAASVGITLCSINPTYTPDEIFYHIQHCGAKYILTFPEKLQDMQTVLEKLITGGAGKKFHIICTRSLYNNKTPLPEDVTYLDDIIKNNISFSNIDKVIQSNVDLFNKLAFIAHSSGTTGLPKGVSLSHQNVTASILQMACQPMTLFRETTSTHQDVIPIVLPLFHNLALEVVLDALYHGSRIITFPKFEEKTFISVLTNEKATMLFVVPPMVLFIGSKDEITSVHLKHVRCMFSAAAPIGDEDILRCLQKAPTGTQFLQGYGLTEAMCLLTQIPHGARNFKSVGVPLVNTEMKVIDLNTGLSKPAHQHGEICFRGPQMSMGYLNNPKATADTIDSEGWFHSGDVGYYDDEGYFYVVDRIKEMIKVKGFQVAPAELEAVLRSHPSIDDAAVTGMPDEWKGEVPVAFIKVKQGQNLSQDEVKRFLSGKIASYKMVHRCIFIDAIPKSASGKILRRTLKNLCRQ